MPRGLLRHSHCKGLALRIFSFIAVAMVGFGFVTSTASGQPYEFSTIAGDIGFGSADGVNSAARFNYPRGITLDSSGNLYIADSANGTIRKVVRVGTNWVCVTIAGTPGQSGSIDGTNAMARFSTPFGIVEDSLGNVYVADYGGHTIRQITPLGT